MNDHLYHYRARVISVYDGDTIRCDVDLGMRTWLLNKSVRLWGIDTPELRGDEREYGLVARDRVRQLILDKEIVLETMRDATGKYGRLLGIVHAELCGRWMNVNEKLLTEGLAKEYEK